LDRVGGTSILMMDVCAFVDNIDVACMYNLNLCKIIFLIPNLVWDDPLMQRGPASPNFP
jgi:hypothetical protein